MGNVHDNGCLCEVEAMPSAPDFCPQCEALGPGLLKALSDEFDYALGLTNGVVIRFSQARLSGQHDWIYLEQAADLGEPKDFTTALGYPCPRGVYVRVSSIVWVADAPEGS